MFQLYLLRAERFVFSIIAVLFVIDAILIMAKGIRVDVAGYGLSLSSGAGLMMIGQLYRTGKRNRNLAAALVSAGLFILFSIAASIFNYMFLPLGSGTIDATLMRVDATLGYDWERLVLWVAIHPWIGKLLFLVYLSSLPQLIVIVISLGFTGDIDRLHRFLITGVLGAMTSIGFWIVFPSFGTTPYTDLPDWVARTIPLAVDPAYGQELLRLAREGVDYLSPAHVLGLIGFPSFHIFMAAMSVYFVPRYTAAIVIVWTLNILMIPAVLVQGGHHLTDVIGGLALFAIVCPLSSSLLLRLTRQERPSLPVEATLNEALAQEKG